MEHALEVLEMLAAAGSPIGVTDVAKRLGISAAGAYRLLNTLLSHGYAQQDPYTSQYSIGLHAFALATLASSSQDVRERARRCLQELNTATGETCHLAAYHHGWVIYIDRLESHHPVAPVSRIGDRAPAHCVATGLAILAFLPHAEVDSIVAEGIERYTDRTLVERDEIILRLADVRRRGWALNEGMWRAEVCGVAAPVREWSGRVVASIGVCLPASRLTEERTPELAEITLAAAARLSGELGFVNPPAALSTDGPMER